jgi:hypothetical protein
MQWPYFQLLCNLKNPFAQFLKQQGVISFKEKQGRKGWRAEKKKKQNNRETET